MKRKDVWKIALFILGISVVIFGVYFGYSGWNSDRGSSALPVMEGNGGNSVTTEKVARFNETEDDIGYPNVGVFIADFHEKYNKSLGWGGINSVKWVEQQKTATGILAVIDSVKTDNTALQEDFKSIFEFAKQVESGDKNKKVLLKLHRYFHDLDIRFNGYSDTSDYFNITKFKGE